MPTDRSLTVATGLDAFVSDALSGTGLTREGFWSGLESIFEAVAPRIHGLLAERARLQHRLDVWHAAHPGRAGSQEYTAFLRDIGYLVPDRDPSVTTANAAPELAAQCGPQLVVPVTNARYAINAVNARWVSLYDSIYGTDALIPQEQISDRPATVVRTVRELLDHHVPLETGSHADTTGFSVVDGALIVHARGARTGLLAPEGFVGFSGEPEQPTMIALQHNGLRLLVDIDRSTSPGAVDAAGISDVRIEAAPTTIVDLEDSVAVVDADDKVLAYRNWWGLCRGDLTARFLKAGSVIDRSLAPPIVLRTPGGALTQLPGRSHMLVRGVGLHMTTDAVLDADGQPVPEGILDIAITALCATLASRGGRTEQTLAVVVPKLHGPTEVALAVEVFARVEALLGLREHTLLLGLMDEERRTSANLGACIAAASDRVVFINTGFLDRSGDEIRSVMNAGVVPGRDSLRSAAWMASYESRNVAAGLRAGLAGRGQIGKGMWAQPDEMGRMMTEKIAHPTAGASTAWVPSPTAAALHALHYWDVDVRSRQRKLVVESTGGDDLSALLTASVVDPADLSTEYVQRELDNNVQAILGYVSRWVDQGIGCSTVPDVDGVGRMEDRATLRISSQLVANWLHHDLVSPAQVDEALDRMARLVDNQSANEPAHVPLDSDSYAFRAARSLIFEWADHPNGYTETALHRFRRLAKCRARMARVRAER